MAIRRSYSVQGIQFNVVNMTQENNFQISSTRGKLLAARQKRLTRKGFPDRRGAPGVKQTKEHNEKIRQSMKGQNRGQRDNATKEAMSVSAQLRWADPEQRRQISMQLRNKPKTCSFCGYVGGHNRRTCPALAIVDRAQTLKMQRLQVTLSLILEQLQVNGQQLQLCAYCGVTGHQLQQCPELVQQGIVGCPICSSQEHSGPECKAIEGLINIPEDVTKAVNGNSQLQMVLEKLKGDKSKRVEVVGEYLSGADQEENFRQRAWQYLFDSQLRDPFHTGTIPADVTCPPILEQDQVNQLAMASIYRAYLQGIYRQRVDLPLSSQQSWPGGIQQQFMQIKPVVEDIIKGLKQQQDLQGRLGVEIWDKGDAVGAWEGDKMFAVLFPTANELSRIKEKVSTNSRLSILFNPQWQLGGQIISDFGFGESKRQGEKLVNSFQQIFYHEIVGISGDQLLIIRAFPLMWHIYLLNPSPQLVLKTEKKPSYSQLEQVLQDMDSSPSGLTWVDRLQRIGNWGNDETTQLNTEIDDPSFIDNEILIEDDDVDFEHEMNTLDIVTGEDV